MEDFPAGPACPEPRRPPISVVIPVRNGGAAFERCLRGLRDSVCNGLDYELIVVDDGSVDESANVARAFGANVLVHETPSGPAAARNTGAQAASSSIVFFLDADVVPHPDCLSRVAEHFERNPTLAALFGSYDDRPDAHGVVSRFRNLLHHYVHQRGEFEREVRPAHTFWTGCGAIRREVFINIGGFDRSLYRRPAIEDIELGYRLTRAEYSIALARDVLVTHLKRWTLRSMLTTDVLHRGIPWMLLMLRTRTDETDLNVNSGQRACVATTGLGLLGLVGSVLIPHAVGLFVLNLAVMATVNRGFYRFLAQRQGWLFALRALPLHYLYFCCCGLSVVLAFVIHHAPRRRVRKVITNRTTHMAHLNPPNAPRASKASARRRSSWIIRRTSR